MDEVHPGFFVLAFGLEIVWLSDYAERTVALRVGLATLVKDALVSVVVLGGDHHEHDGAAFVEVLADEIMDKDYVFLCLLGCSTLNQAR